ncbi:MAG: single-stranded DNA-binding protein [Phycisphaerales bacterium]|nr:single-stranded DNA-binding protein [Phycisphaerales bacterium]MCI0630878.1 single-stranded DNA-binding protein [Phycisphaerales bacterium]MCI0676179.1 single-stranded DNA-binding protein [Phycisphaerales bacterium]
MPDYNKVLLMGRLTRDIELKYTPSNMAVAKVGLAVNHRYKTKEGESKEDTTFVECDAWGRTAEVMSQYLSKGKPVFVEGRLKLDTWQDKDGGNRSMLKVVIENFQFIDSKGAGATAAGAAAAPEYAGAAPPAARSAGASAKSQGAYTGPQHEALGEDEIPF